MKFQVLTVAKISAVIFWGSDPCTLKDGYQRPKRPRHRSDTQSSVSHCSILLSSTWDVRWKKKDCNLPVATPSMLHIHLPSKVSKIGPYDAAVA